MQRTRLQSAVGWGLLGLRLTARWAYTLVVLIPILYREVRDGELDG